MSTNDSISLLQKVLIVFSKLFHRMGGLNTWWGLRLYYYTYSIYKKRFEDSYSWLTLKHPELFNHGSILDIGAFLGYTSSLYLKASSFNVVSLEPEVNNFRWLKQLHKSSRLTVLNKALDRINGTLTLKINNTQISDHRVLDLFFDSKQNAMEGFKEIETIKLSTLVESYFSDQPLAFVKIDIQGNEWKILEDVFVTLQNKRFSQTTFGIEYAPAYILEMGGDIETFYNQLFATPAYIYAVIRKKIRWQLVTVQNKEDLELLCKTSPYFDLLISLKSIS